MKKLLIIGALLIGAVSFSNAQGGGFNQGTPAERAQRTVDGQMFAALNLTADQKTKTLALLTTQNKSTDSLRATIPAGSDMRTAMQELRPKITVIAGANETKFISWLNADQKKAYETAMAAMKATNPNASFGGGGRGGR